MAGSKAGKPRTGKPKPTTKTTPGRRHAPPAKKPRTTMEQKLTHTTMHKEPAPKPAPEPDPEGPEDEQTQPKTSGIVVKMPWAEPAVPAKE